MAVSTAVDQDAVARVIGVKTEFKDLRKGRVKFLPMRVSVIGQGASGHTYSTEKRQVFSAYEVGRDFGFGSPLHLAVRQLLPVNGDGVGGIAVTVIPVDAAGGAAIAAGSIAPSGTPTRNESYRVVAGGIKSVPFTVLKDATPAEIVTAMHNAVTESVDMPVTSADDSTKQDLTAKWAGASGDDIQVSVEGPTDTGVTFAVTQPTGGATDPDIAPALAKIGNVWETIIVNCFGIDNTDALDALSAWGEGRWGALVRKPAVAFVGVNEANVLTASTVTDTRKNDRVNSAIAVPGSNELPCSTAARAAARIATVAGANPPMGYAEQRLTGITGGTDGEQWDYAARNAAVKRGCGTTLTGSDGVPTLQDTVTMFHPDGSPDNEYRYVVRIIKLMNVLFNIDVIFANTKWAGAPLIPDHQPTSNPSAKKPKHAVTAVNNLIDYLALEAILSDPETAKKSTVAAISESNPERLDVSTTVQISGNANVISFDLNFGFYFGVSPII